MPFVVFGNDPFVQADICEMLVSEYPDEAIVAADTESEALKLSDDLEGPLTVLLVMHEDIVRVSRSILRDGKREGSIILIRNEPPCGEETTLPLHYLSKPFGTRDLVALVRTARASPPAIPS